MKRWVMAVVAAAVLAAGQARGAGEDAEARYQALAARAKAGEPVDWAALRFAYADRPKFPAVPQDVHTQMRAAIAAKDYETALARATTLTDADFADGEAHLAAGMAYRGLGRLGEADRERSIAQAIFKSMLTGDGLSPARAYTVVSVAEEYQLMAALGHRVTGQQLTYAGGHAYDVLTVASEAGAPTAYYFLIDRVLEAERKLFEPGK